MGVKIRVNRGKLYLDIYRHGKRRWEALKLSVGNDKQADKEAMRVAEICRAKRELQLVSGDWGIADPVSGSKTFLAYTREIGAERSPKDRVNLMARYLERYPGGNIQIAQIGAKWIEDFQTYLLTRCGLSRNTAASYSTALRIVLNRAVRDSVIPRNPAAGVRKIPDEDTDRVHLSAEEAAAMAGADGGDDLGEECKKAFVLACLTGLRVSDLEDLKWGDVDRDRLHKRQHKTGDIAHVPLSASALEIIGGCENHKPDERIFPLLLERGRDASNYRIRRLARTAGIRKRVGWHTARHTFAVLSLEAGTGIYTLSRLLGHRSVKTTEVYARATDKLKREAVDALPDLRIKKLP